MNVQGSDGARTANSETHDTTSQNHTPYLAGGGLDQRPQRKQNIRSKYDPPPTVFVSEYTSEGTRNQSE